MQELNGRWTAKIDSKCPLKIEPINDTSFAEFVQALSEDYPQCKFHKVVDKPLHNDIINLMEMKRINER